MAAPFTPKKLQRNPTLKIPIFQAPYNRPISFFQLNDFQPRSLWPAQWLRQSAYSDALTGSTQAAAAVAKLEVLGPISEVVKDYPKKFRNDTSFYSDRANYWPGLFFSHRSQASGNFPVWGYQSVIPNNNPINRYSEKFLPSRTGFNLVGSSTHDEVFFMNLCTDEDLFTTAAAAMTYTTSQWYLSGLTFATLSPFSIGGVTSNFPNLGHFANAISNGIPLNTGYTIFKVDEFGAGTLNFGMMKFFETGFSFTSKLINVDFDDPNLNGYTGWSTAASCHATPFGFLLSASVVPSTFTYNNYGWFMALINEDLESYTPIEILPQSNAALTEMQRIGQKSIKIDNAGFFYLCGPGSANGEVFTNFGLELDIWKPVIPPITLTCPIGCNSVPMEYGKL